MYVDNYENELREYVLNEDIPGANDFLMKKLGHIVVSNKTDFIDLLNENGIEADESMPSKQLIELFSDNTNDKDLLIGASLLVEMGNKKIGFDGEQHVNDENVKTGVAVMDSFFNEAIPDEKYSYIAPFLIGAISKGAKKLIQKKRKSDIGAKRRGKSKRSSSDRLRQIAEFKMKQEALYRQKLAFEAAKVKAEKDKRKRKKRNTIIIASSLSVAVLVGILLYKRNNG